VAFSTEPLRRNVAIGRAAATAALHWSPIAFCIALLYLAARPAEVQERVPDVLAPLSRLRNVSFFEALPPHPRSISQAWALGRIEENIESASRGANLTDADAARRFPMQLATATRVLQVRDRNITWSELRHARQTAVDRQEGKGLVSRALGLLTFSRVLWFAGVCGILVTAVPASIALLHVTGLLPLLLAVLSQAYALLRALWSVVHGLFGGRVLAALRGLAVLAWTHPLARQLHQPAALAVVWLVFLHAVGFRDSGARTYTLLFACGLAGAALSIERPQVWRSQVVPPAAPGVGSLLRKGAAPTALYAATILLTSAYLGQSPLLAYLGLLAIYQALGFVVAAFGGGYIVGFSGQNALQRTTLASLLVLAATVLLRVSHPHLLAGAEEAEGGGTAAEQAVLQSFTPAGLAVLASPAQVSSQILFFLGMLITSDAACVRFANESYAAAQVRMLLSLLAGAYVGAVFAMPSLLNTACVFAVLFALGKTVDARMWRAEGVMLTAFGASLLAWRGALFLHTHPAFVLGLFSDSAAERARYALLEGGALRDLGTVDAVLGAVALLSLALAGLVAVGKR
jgi:hypothetical protein